MKILQKYYLQHGVSGFFFKILRSLGNRLCQLISTRFERYFSLNLWILVFGNLIFRFVVVKILAQNLILTLIRTLIQTLTKTSPRSPRPSTLWFKSLTTVSLHLQDENNGQWPSFIAGSDVDQTRLTLNYCLFHIHFNNKTLFKCKSITQIIKLLSNRKLKLKNWN